MMFSSPNVARCCGRARVIVSSAVPAMVLACFSGCLVLHAQAQNPCGTDGYRIVARSWDALLKRGWESRQDCAHLEWPLRMVATHAEDSNAHSSIVAKNIGNTVSIEPTAIQSPLLVRAGDIVRLWMQDVSVRVEMSGVAERSAHHGEHVTVQVTKHDDETGLTVQRITGTVSGAGEVEMER